MANNEINNKPQSIKIGAITYKIEYKDIIRVGSDESWCFYHDEHDNILQIKQNTHIYQILYSYIGFIFDLIQNILKLEIDENTGKLNRLVNCFIYVITHNPKLIESIKTDIFDIDYVDIYGFKTNVSVKSDIEYTNRIGYYEASKYEIAIQSNFCDSTKIETVIHEILHAIDYKITGHTEMQLFKESEINSMANYLHLIMKDNIDLIEYVIEQWNRYK